MHRRIKSIKTDYRTIIGYQSYYLYGFMRENYNIKFSRLDIDINNHDDYRRGGAWLIELENGQLKKLYIDTNDRNDINELFYDWSNVYAKINLRHEDLKRDKVLPIGPSFGISIWNPVQTMFHSIYNRMRWCKGYREPWKSYIKDYAYLFVRRAKYPKYNIECVEDRDYIYTLNTLWYDDETYCSTNRLRGVFARACKELFTTFQGGFFYIPNVESEFPKYREYLEDYKDMLINKRVSMSEYMNCIEKSSFVFNTPSVCGCHGWKMAEYLAMGKAMISTHINNVMPGEFLAGEHYIEANTDEEIRNSVKLLKDNPQIISKLKKNSVQYFNDYLAPEAVVGRIIDKLYE